MDTQRVPTTLEEARLAILRQHVQIAQLMDELEVHARAALGMDAFDEARGLAKALALLHKRFMLHLQYENAYVATLLPSAAESLLGDHGDQEERLLGLVHDGRVFGDPRTLAGEALTFVHLLRREMAEEEKRLREIR